MPQQPEPGPPRSPRPPQCWAWRGGAHHRRGREQRPEPSLGQKDRLKLAFGEGEALGERQYCSCYGQSSSRGRGTPSGTDSLHERSPRQSLLGCVGL